MCSKCPENVHSLFYNENHVVLIVTQCEYAIKVPNHGISVLKQENLTDHVTKKPKKVGDIYLTV